MEEHSAGEESLHNRRRGVRRLIWSEPRPDQPSARRRETQLKGWTRAKKLALARGDLALLKKM